MLNGGLCRIFPLIQGFSFTVTASQSTLTLTQPSFHFFLFFVYFLTFQPPSFPPFCAFCIPCLLPFWVDLQFPVLGGLLGGGDSRVLESEAFKSLFISEAIRRHLVPHAQFVTEQNARRCPWGWPVAIALPDTQRERGERKRERGGAERAEREPAAEGEWTWQRPWNTSVPLSRAGGTAAAACQHLSLVKCRLSDNVTLITKSPDSDFLPLYV